MLYTYTSSEKFDSIINSQINRNLKKSYVLKMPKTFILYNNNDEKFLTKKIVNKNSKKINKIVLKNWPMNNLSFFSFQINLLIFQNSYKFSQFFYVLENCFQNFDR